MCELLIANNSIISFQHLLISYDPQIVKAKITILYSLSILNILNISLGPREVGGTSRQLERTAHGSCSKIIGFCDIVSVLT